MPTPKIAVLESSRQGLCVALHMWLFRTPFFVEQSTFDSQSRGAISPTPTVQYTQNAKAALALAGMINIGCVWLVVLV